MKHLFVLLLLMVIALGCESVLPKKEAISHEMNPKFSLNFPASDWKLVNQQGTDSYVGYYTNGKEKIYFDSGWYGASLSRDKSLYYEEVNLKKCDCNAVIAREKTANGTKLTALFFKQGKLDRTTLYVNNPQDEKMFIKIFKTHLFK